MAFTPGPWEWPYGDTVWAGGKPIVEVFSEDPIADANLIAAAPDLYEALRLISTLPIPKEQVIVPMEDGVVEMPLTWGYLTDHIHAALAKARGKP